MSNNIRILFYLNNHKKNSTAECSLMLRITFSGKIKQISTGFYLRKEQWNHNLKQVKGQKSDAVQINHYILTTRARLTDIFTQQLADGDLNLDNLFDTFMGRDVSLITLLQAIKYHNNNFQSRIGIDYSFSTFQKYDITLKKIKAFLDFNNKTDVRLKDLNKNFISEFECFLKTTEKNQHNTAIKYCKNLKKILSMCVSNDWLEKNPFDGYACAYKVTDQVFLLEHELQQIVNKEFNIKRLELVRDLFIFQCYTGLAFSDMASLTKNDITEGVDGNKWIIKNRQKTRIQYSIPLLPEALNILNKYNPVEYKDPLLPIYSIQRFNAYLDEIATLTGINKRISSHVGRRTFGNLALSKGISLNVISKMMGHSNTLITQKIYAITQVQLISEEMNKLRKL